MSPSSSQVDYLLTTHAVRERCANILKAVLAGKSHHFTVDMASLQRAADIVMELTHARFPNNVIPYHSRWRHFEAGHIDRLAKLRGPTEKIARAKQEIDLAVTAVLLDAGAGERWTYREAEGWQGGRSEGLGVAAFHAFDAGLFGRTSLGSNEDYSIANTTSLSSVTVSAISQAFQVCDKNPLVGLEGRTSLLVRLADALRANPDFFGTDQEGNGARPGNMLDYLLRNASGANADQQCIHVSEIFNVVLKGFASIWLTPNALSGVSLGDCWQHPQAVGEGLSNGWVPFHKLSQWMCYSLLEPIERAGIAIEGVDYLTGLPEYRNGGLLLDCGVIRLRNSSAASQVYKVGDELIVEWRALTVALLDLLAQRIREIKGLTAEQLPLACVLEGGSWAAGRLTAQRLRNGLPPLSVQSDGTVF